MHFRLLSYNIHRAIGVDRRFRPERIARILAHHDADIVLLQEVDEGVPRSREMDLARELALGLGYPHLAIGHNVTLRRGRYGNATLSRHPILRERNIDLTIAGRKRRGCQHTAIELEGPNGARHALDVFNLHLGLSARERELQLGLLLCSSEFSELPHDAPTIVAGDFNDWRSLLQPLLISQLAFRSATGPHALQEHASRTYPSFFPRGPLDRIYFRGPVRTVSARRCRLRLSRVASDHLPIIAEFAIR
jgi:endonuclease/exonuclease/phosphatase family metal-dependent hydrolase